VTEKIIHYDHRCYSGQFSDDGNFFFCCSQDFKVRMYDTANPYDWKYYKMVDYPYPRWTITDASLSPDNRFLAYSSIEPTVCLAATDPSSDSDPIPLNFSRGRRRAHLGGYFGSSHFGVCNIVACCTHDANCLLRFGQSGSPEMGGRSLPARQKTVLLCTTSNHTRRSSVYRTTTTM
jgi:WD40 repeat protein